MIKPTNSPSSSAGAPSSRTSHSAASRAPSRAFSAPTAPARPPRCGCSSILSQPDSGYAQILGGRYRDLPNPGRRVGILLDASAQHAERRGREALAVSAHTMGVPAQRVDALLELVGLDKTAARRRVGKYSLGMRQRLGFAHACSAT